MDFAPAWSRGDAHLEGPPDNPQDLGDFVFALVDRYRLGSPFGRIHAVELWNEPNPAREWGGRRPHAAEYVQLLRAGFEGAKRADPKDKKADFLVRAYQWALNNWPWMGPMAVWNLPDPAWGPEREEFWWSIANPDGTHRPAYERLRQARRTGELP